MTDPLEPSRPTAPSRESFTRGVRQVARDSVVGLVEDVVTGVVVLVVLAVLVGGGAALGSAIGAGWLVGGLAGAGAFGVLALVVLVRGGIDGVRDLRRALRD